MRTRSLVLIGAGVAAVAVAAVFLTGPIIRGIRYGTVVPVPATKDASQDLTVKVGDRFSIVSRDNASIGDSWWLKTKPQYVNAALEHDEYVSMSSSDSTGGGGRHYWTFVAKKASTNEIVLVNDFQAGREQYTVTITLTITG
ncbi:protease inhibitor I42 family protein [Actinocrispum sp. NPDC049592]|uniref:protease inhibitor I42 family protein n=1 Tax=Actinocrispum sp. NPDC049592 TaxID=3154835 RepID=UPI00341C5702